jgi:hypothetical protein
MFAPIAFPIVINTLVTRIFFVGKRMQRIGLSGMKNLVEGFDLDISCDINKKQKNTIKRSKAISSSVIG